MASIVLPLPIYAVDLRHSDVMPFVRFCVTYAEWIVVSSSHFVQFVWFYIFPIQNNGVICAVLCPTYGE